MKLLEEASYQKAPLAVCPAGRIEARSFNETLTTLERKFVASRNSSVTVLTSILFGDISPALPVVPTDFTEGSSVQYHFSPVSWLIQLLPTMPVIAGTDPVKAMVCPTAV